ncbi:hypothetical protein ACFLXQ_06185, partial [Chloroflexota bacterium]
MEQQLRHNGTQRKTFQCYENDSTQRPHFTGCSHSQSHTTRLYASHSAKQSLPQQQNSRQFETNMRAIPTRKKTLLGQSGANALLGGHRPRYTDCDTTAAANGGA